MKILCIGEEWRGSDASGLFNALSRVGNVVTIVNNLRFLSYSGRNLTTKIVNKLARSFQVDDFNDQVIITAKSFRPEIILIYKGMGVRPETIQFFKSISVPVINFYPDVSFMVHGEEVSQCMPLYDHIFTTKSFGADDLYKVFGFDRSKVSFIPHGFDPTVHRPISLKTSEFDCEVSFIGNYSNHKFSILKGMKEALHEVDLKIWGATWRGGKNSVLNTSIQNCGIFGDLYACAINSSRINLGLLSEQVLGASSGDRTTARTFHITGSGGFMVHERTEEIGNYFEENKEIVCFSTVDELAEKVTYFLRNDGLRMKIMANGYNRALSEHSLDRRAIELMNILCQKGIING
jgi:spore maturation protein CgeB